MLLASIAVVFTYIGYCWLYKAWEQRGKMDTVAAGMLRVAATRDVATLELLSRVLHFDPNAAFEGFTALHAACVEGKAGEHTRHFGQAGR